MSEPQTFTAESDPKDFNGDVVIAYLATADEAEKTRVFGLETAEGGKDRKGVKDAATAEPVGPTDDQPKEGLASTGNPNDLSTKPEAVSANIAHQEGAPEALTKVADESAAQGFFGESADKPDYSQANAEVMNGGGKS